MSRGFLVWLLIMLAETVHGVLRGLLLVPKFGEVAAGRIGWPIGMIIVLVISTFCIRWTRINTVSGLLRLGAVWAVLTFLFELVIGLLRGLPADRLRADINPLEGGLILLTAAFMFVAPLLAYKLRMLGKRPEQ